MRFNKLGKRSFWKSRNIYQKAIIFILTAGALFLVGHLLILYGALNERESRICMSAEEMSRVENVISLSEAICVDVQTNQLAEIKSNYEERATQAEKNAERWRGASASANKKLEDLKKSYEEPKTQEENARDAVE